MDSQFEKLKNCNNVCGTLSDIKDSISSYQSQSKQTCSSAKASSASSKSEDANVNLTKIKNEAFDACDEAIAHIESEFSTRSKIKSKLKPNQSKDIFYWSMDFFNG